MKELYNIVEYVFVSRIVYDNMDISEKRSNILFFIEDTGEIFKGTIPMANSVLVVDTLPDNPSPDKIYIYNGILYKYTESVWTPIDIKVYANDSITDDDGAGIIVSQKAIKEYTQKIVLYYKRLGIFNNMDDAIKYIKSDQCVAGEHISVLSNSSYIPYIVAPDKTLQPIATGSGGTGSSNTFNSSSTILADVNNNMVTHQVKIDPTSGNALTITKDGLYVANSGTRIPITVIQ